MNVQIQMEIVLLLGIMAVGFIACGYFLNRIAIHLNPETFLEKMFPPHILQAFIKQVESSLEPYDSVHPEDCECDQCIEKFGVGLEDTLHELAIDICNLVIRDIHTQQYLEVYNAKISYSFTHDFLKATKFHTRRSAIDTIRIMKETDYERKKDFPGDARIREFEIVTVY